MKNEISSIIRNYTFRFPHLRAADASISFCVSFSYSTSSSSSTSRFRYFRYRRFSASGSFDISTIVNSCLFYEITVVQSRSANRRKRSYNKVAYNNFENDGENNSGCPPLIGNNNDTIRQRTLIIVDAKIDIP